MDNSVIFCLGVFYISLGNTASDGDTAEQPATYSETLNLLNESMLSVVESMKDCLVQEHLNTSFSV